MPHTDPEVRRAYNRAYRLKNLARLREQKRAKRLADPERARALDHAAYLRKDKMKKNARERLRYCKRRSQEAARKRRAYLENPDPWFERTRRRRARQYEAPFNDFTAVQWKEMKAAYGCRCAYCGKKPRKLEQEHITPLSKGGSHTASNIVPSCLQCNRRKGAGEPLVPVQPLLLMIAAARKKDVA